MGELEPDYACFHHPVDAKCELLNERLGEIPCEILTIKRATDPSAPPGKSSPSLQEIDPLRGRFKSVFAQVGVLSFFQLKDLSNFKTTRFALFPRRDHQTRLLS